MSDTPPTFIPGLKLSEFFYHEAVAPILAAAYPQLPHSAALIGSGSEVLGFDTPMSADHHWGPRVLLFLRPGDREHYGPAIDQTLRARLPHRCHGYPTSFSAPDPEDNGVQLLQATSEGPVNHRVEILTVPGFFLDYLGADLEQPAAAADWLTYGDQRLLTVTAGAVFHDDLGLEAARARFAYYPHDVWLYLLACGWARVGQEEHLMGRAGSVGDELGSALIGARLVRDVMRLCFLMERRYAPYPKWFGTAFARLQCAPALLPTLRAATTAATWQEREPHLVAAYERLAEMHNRLGLTEPLETGGRPFFGRPFLVIGGARFSAALLGRITDPDVARLARRRPIGAVDQFSDSTDLLADTSRQGALRGLYLEPR